jgi:hypothetical protein
VVRIANIVDIEPQKIAQLSKGEQATVREADVVGGPF